MKAETDCWRYRYVNGERQGQLFKQGDEIPVGWYDDWRKALEASTKRGRPRVKSDDK